MIAAVQASIDGPTGWLGRSLGEQVLEMTSACFSRNIRLPYEPVSSIDSVKYRDLDGAEQTIDEQNYRLVSGNRLAFTADFRVPATDTLCSGPIITYSSGYSAAQMPPSAKQAVVIGVQQLKAMTEQSLLLRSETVEGVGTTSYLLSDAMTDVVRAAMEMLLSPLRVYWL